MKPKVRNLWKEMNEFCSPNILLKYSVSELSVVQVLIFVLNYLRDAEFFIEFGKRHHNVEATEERFSEP